MNKNEMNKVEKQLELISCFKPIIKELKKKYNNYTLDFYINYDSILISSHDKEIEKDMMSITNYLIKQAKENFDEDYFLPIETPGIISSYPEMNDIIYHWLLERRLKEPV